MTRPPCPVADACETCSVRAASATGGLAAAVAATPVGDICLTLCGSCEASGSTPLLDVLTATRRALQHAQHAGAGDQDGSAWFAWHQGVGR